MARTEYQTFNVEIAKGTHASSLEAMKNTLATMPQEIALIEAKFNSIKMPDNVKTQIEELKASMESINSISDPQEKIAKYNEMVSSLKSLQKQYQVTSQEQKNLNTDMATMQGIVSEGYGHMLKRTCVDQYKKKCLIFYANNRIVEIKDEEDAISRAKYEEKHTSSRKEMADTRMSELIKKAREVR